MPLAHTYTHTHSALAECMRLSSKGTREIMEAEEAAEGGRRVLYA